jgi:hypothetical protein
MTARKEQALEPSQPHKKPTKQPDFTIMEWDTSATLQLISIIGSILGVIVVWFQRKHIAAVSRWVLGIPLPLHFTYARVLTLTQPELALSARLAVIAIRSKLSNFLARIHGTIRMSKRARRLQLGRRKQG